MNDQPDLAASALFDVRGRSALVTGGSRGIGRMIAETLVTNGAKVTITARNPKDLSATAEELSLTGECTAVAADLADPTEIDRLAAAVIEQHAGLDILVNNAGAAWASPIGSFPAEAFDTVLSVNVTAPFLLTQALLPALRRAATPEAPARVVMVGSVHGLLTPMMDNYSYSASKAAIHHLTRHLAVHLSAEHITVNAIAPGAFETRMTEPYFGEETGKRVVERNVPLGRVGTPTDIAGATLLLTGPAGAYLTGAVIPIDGGLTAR